ncbi:MAG: DUF1446 domain-containing protein [Bacteroidota bacterium]|nr:DUF1446 domain-containing protein [Bacteroidota bacterium]
MKTIRIGSGAGFSGDRIEPAIVLAEKGALDYLVLECLAERTIALAQKRKLQDPSAGYDILLEKRCRPLLPLLAANKVRLISNMGAANPLAAAKKLQSTANELGLKLKIAAVTGDDVLEYVRQHAGNLKAMETGGGIDTYTPVSANAYLGAEALLPALASGADIIITGRVADPSLFLAPMIHEFGWQLNDWQRLGQGTVIGHLLECAGQLTGGYYADTNKKQVPGLAHLGFPLAAVDANGEATITKVENTGGIINSATAKEQLLYEVVNPSAYLTPDVSADFTRVQIHEAGADLIRVTGSSGTDRPAQLKASVGYSAYYLGEGEITYGGTDCLQRAELAAAIIHERIGAQFEDVRADIIGVQSLYPSKQDAKPAEVRLRIAARAKNIEAAMLIGEEVEALYTNGPAGGGGVRKSATEQIGIVSCLVPRDIIKIETHYFES